MKLKKFLKAAHNQISDGSEYGWKCYGDNARWLDVADQAGTQFGCCVYDTKTQKVFEIEAFNDNYGTHYTWRDENYEDAYEQECSDRKVVPYVAYDEMITNMVNKASILSILESYASGSEPAVGLTPDMVWPFPPLSPSDDIEDVNSPDSDWDEVIDKQETGEVTDDEINSLFPGAFVKKEYEVIITAEHRFTVKANTTMEEATNRAATWVEGMKGYDWPEDTVWEEHYVTKKQVGVNCG